MRSPTRSGHLHPIPVQSITDMLGDAVMGDDGALLARRDDNP